jgi:ATP-dependent Clp protease ATP-binding subunit ClpC
MNPEIFEKFSPNLKKALIMAERISREQNMKMDTEHQLLSLILLKGTLANDILSMFEVNADRVQLIASLVSKTETPKPIDGMNKPAKEAIQYSVQFASKFHHSFVDCEHLLLSLISKKQFNSYQIIERMGIDPAEIKKQIESIFSEIDKSRKEEGISIDEIPEPPLNEEGMDMGGMGGMGGMGPIPGMPPTMTIQKKQSALKQFTSDITEMATKGELDPVVGRPWNGKNCLCRGSGTADREWGSTIFNCKQKNSITRYGIAFGRNYVSRTIRIQDEIHS